MLTYHSVMTEASIPRPSQLWKQLSPERKAQAADAFWRDENAAAEQAEAVAAMAQRLKFRPKSAMALPAEKKSRYLLAMPGLSEIVAARLLVVYHLEHQRAMMSAFLDALDISHDNGLIMAEQIEAPDPVKLRSAAATLGKSFPAADVALYLSTLLWQDPDTWGGLVKVPEVLDGAQG
ncbi:MAG: hypothetical protein ACRD26_22460 [Vicinamibacterales bacterium]